MRAFHTARLAGLLAFGVAFAPLIVAADPSMDATVATLKDQSITFAQLPATIQQKLDEQQKAHEKEVRRLEAAFRRTRQAFIEEQIGQLLDKQVLDLEAAARKTTPDALTGAIKTVTVTDAQLQSFYESQRAQISQPFESIAPKIRLYLQNQADQQARRQYLDGLRARYRAVVTVEPLRETVEAIGPQRGPNDAPVTIVEFSDFQCPFCARLAPVLKQLLVAYPTQVRMVYRHFPIKEIHPNAEKAAEAAVCASNQSKFWEMHDTLFAEQSSLDLEALKDKASRLGLDTKQFNECLDGGTSSAAIASDVAAGESLGLGATPASFINGRFVDGAVSLDRLTALVNDELRRAGLKPISQTAASGARQ